MTYQTKHPPRLRFISAVLSLAMLLTLLPTAAFAAVQYGTEGDYDYYDSDGVIGIRVYNGTDVDVVIPDTLNGKPVKILAIGSLQHDHNMVSVWIPASVTRIDNSAFYNLKNLKTVTFAPGSQLETINGSFSDSGVTTIELPDSLKTIGKGTFMHCHGLKSVTIPSGVETIGENAFYNCRCLETISIPASVTSIGESVFGLCSNLKTIEYEGTKKKWEELTNGVDLGIDSEQDVVYSFGNVRETATVQFDENADNLGITGIVKVPLPQIVDIGGYADEPEELWYGGWCTTGWYTDMEGADTNDLSKKFDFENTPITEDITLYAGWVKTYYLKIGDVRVTTENRDDALGDGTARYDPDTHTLTLKNANLHGDSEYHVAIAYTGYAPLTVTGSATLYGDVGIHSEASDLNIENADLTFLTEITAETVGDAYMSIGFTGRNGMTIRNSALKIESASGSGQRVCTYPYISNGDILIQNSNISVDDGVQCEYGLSSDTSLTIDNSEVTIRNANVVAAVGGKKLTISGADTWIDAAINTDASKYAPIWCKNGIDLQDGLEILENTAQNGVTRMVIGNRDNQVFTVTFEMNGHGEQELTQKVKNGASPAIPAYPDAEGWYFAGWYADPECTEAADFSLPIQKNTIFYAKWDKMHTIHFELNGHGNEGYYNNDQEIRDGSALGELGLAWDDEWYFAGWFTDPELTTKVNPETIVTGDMICYAKWLKPEGITQYKVSFDLNASDARWDQNFDGWGEWDDAHRVITAETYFDCYDNENEQFVQSVRMEIYAQPERDGYTFKGWYTAPEGGEKMEEKYDVSDVSAGVVGYITYITEDLTFYAQWEKIGGEEKPSQPEQPTEPSNPEKPTEPENPEQPSNPEQPENPDKPTEPEQPTTPTEPSEPEKPSQPENPDKPSEPEQPSKPSEPDKPSQPENPEKPSEPEQPAAPSDPGSDGGGAGAVILLAGGAVVIGTGVAAVGVAAYGIGTELAAWLMLPAGAGMPTTRGELAVVLWKQAGCPAVPMEAPLSETEIALRWAIDHQLADEDAAPEESVSTAEVFKALKKAKDI